jgi:hypothetical protein
MTENTILRPNKVDTPTTETISNQLDATSIQHVDGRKYEVIDHQISLNGWERLARYIACALAIITIIPYFIFPKNISRMKKEADEGIKHQFEKVQRQEFPAFNVNDREVEKILKGFFDRIEKDDKKKFYNLIGKFDPRLDINFNKLKIPQVLPLKDVLGDEMVADPIDSLPRDSSEVHVPGGGLVDGIRSMTFEQTPAEEVLALQPQIQNTNPHHDCVSVDDLQSKGYLPTNKYQFGEATYYFSNTFMLGSSHYGSLALIKIGDKVYPRIVYYSNSQGTWRVMPTASKRMGRLMHFGKGLSETDTQLPIEIMMALNQLPKPKNPEGNILPKANDVMKTKPFCTDTWVRNVREGDFAKIKTGAEQMYFQEGMMVPMPPDPTSIVMPENEGLHPDFSQPLLERKLYMDQYGEVTAKVFPSRDGSIQYMFYEAKDGRAFLTSVEKVTDNPVNIYGVRVESPDLKNMDAPLLEYSCQIPDGCRPSFGADTYQSSKYLSNWNYVRDLAIIKMYYRDQNRTIPSKV